MQRSGTRIAVAGLVLAALAAPAPAQSAEHPDVRPRRVTLRPLDVEALRAQDAAAVAHPGTRRRRVGLRRRFPTIRAPRLLRPGRRVSVAADGSYVWACEVSATGATGLRLHVRRCDLPAGAELTAFDVDEPEEAHGPWTGTGPNETGSFYTPTVFGERVRLELRVPPDSVGLPVRLALDAAAQRYAELSPEPDEPSGDDPQKAASCHRALACDRDYAVEIGRAVALVEFVSRRRVFSCSGTLLEDADETTDIPWLLTANHCISTEAEAQSVECFWDYRADACTGDPPILKALPRTISAKLVVTHPGTDVTLLRLAGVLPSGRFFAPWSAAPLEQGAAVVSVHFPKTSHARISYGTIGQQTTNFDSVRWTIGTTQPGSSGGPLFNEQREVVGQLFGGNAFCSNPQGFDDYGRLATSFPLLREFIDTPPPARLPELDPSDPADDVPAGAVESGMPGVVAVPLDRRLGPSDRADWFVFDLVRKGRYVFRSTGGEDVRAWLYDSPVAVVPIATNDDGAGHLQFRIDHRPKRSSRVWLRVEPFPAVTDRAYAVEALTTTDPAAAVKKLRGNVKRKSGNVLLRWKDKARGEASYLVELDTDGNGAWQRLADLKRNARRFVHKPGPGSGTHRYRVGPFNAAGPTWTEIELTIDAP